MTETTKKKPSYEVFEIETTGENKRRWIKVGAAFTNRDASLNVLLNRDLKRGANIQLRAPKPRETGA